MDICKKEKYDFVDVCKFVACICIVGIHTAAFSDCMGGDYYLQSGVFRLAVPFFFVVSGFFFGKQLLTAKDSRQVLKKYIYRLGVPLAFWETINIVIEILKQLFVKRLPASEIAYNIIKSILFYPYGALWYVQALMIAAIIIAYIYKKGWLEKCLFVSAVLFVAGLLGNSYYFLIYGMSAQKIIDRYLDIFVSTRNGVFVALYFVSAGVWIAAHENWVKRIKGKKIIAISAYIVYFLEIYLIRDCKSADDKSMFLSFLFLIPLLFIVVIDSNLTIAKARALRSYSTGIYFMHKAVIHIWLIVFAVIGVEIFPTVEFAFVLISCFIACTIAYKIDNKFINMLTR